MIRDGRSINGYKPSEYMVSKKCLALTNNMLRCWIAVKTGHVLNTPRAIGEGRVS